MATSQSAPKFSSCPIRNRLIAELLQTHTEIAAINNHELEAVVRGDLEADLQFARKLAAARRRRDAVAHDMREHAAKHGC